jgi:ABC-2 type transport system ATP-binding protein
MSDDIAIKVDHVNKVFKLPHERQSSIKGLIINFGKRGYEKQEVLKDISLDIKKGEFYGIIGRNGSGKSTLLKMLAGIYSPTKGNIQVNGKLTPFIELGVGFNPELTGRENVYLNGALLGFNRREMTEKYEDIVAFAELERFMDQKLKNYSSGMQVRLAFSIAIRADTDILLLDEVLAVGDAVFQQKCYDYFKQLKKNKRTVVFVSHDLGSMEEFCDKIAIIDRGEQIAIGSPNEMILDYETRMAGGTNSIKELTKHTRPGTGQNQVTDVRLSSTSTQGSKVLKAGEKFSIEIDYEVHDLTKNMVCGISIEDMDGVSILGPNTQDAKFDLTPKELGDKGTIKAEFNNNSLVPGTYTVSIGLFDERGVTPYDFFAKATKFKVIGKARHGKIAVEPDWYVSRTTK